MQRQWIVHIIMILAGALWGSMAGAATDVWSVVLRTDVVAVAQPLVSDVVEVQETAGEFLARYGRVSVPAAPGTVVSPVQLLAVLERAGADLSRIVIQAATHPQSINSSSEVAHVVLEQVKAQLAQQFAWSVDDVILQWTDVPRDLPGRAAFATVSAELTQVEGRVGRYRIPVHFLSAEGATIATAEFGGALNVRVPVVVATHALMPAEYVTTDDFRTEKRLLDAEESFVTSLASLGTSRWQVMRGMDSGEGLRKANLQFAEVVRKGEIVTLTAADPRFRVRALGRVKAVLDDGVTVVVENLDSKKEIVGKPVGVNEVQIVF